LRPTHLSYLDPPSSLLLSHNLETAFLALVFRWAQPAIPGDSRIYYTSMPLRDNFLWSISFPGAKLAVNSAQSPSHDNDGRGPRCPPTAGQERSPSASFFCHHRYSGGRKQAAPCRMYGFPSGFRWVFLPRESVPSGPFLGNISERPYYPSLPGVPRIALIRLSSLHVTNREQYSVYLTVLCPRAIVRVANSYRYIGDPSQ